MNSLTIPLVGALFLSAALTTLIYTLWPIGVGAFALLTGLGLFLNGWLSVRLLANRSTAPAPASAPEKKRERQRDGEKRPPAKAKKVDAPRNPPADTPAPPSGDFETGTVKWFNRSKGFGFIIRESGEEIFVHQRSLARTGNGADRQRPSLKDGQKVRFVVADHEKGLQAEHVSSAE